MEQQFRKGDRVRIRFRDFEQEDYKFDFTDEMAELSGKEFTIETAQNHHGNGHEHIVEDDGFAYYLKEEPARHFTWSSGMLEYAGEMYDKIYENESESVENKKDIKSKIRKILYSSIAEGYDKISATDSSIGPFDYWTGSPDFDFRTVTSRSTRR